MKVLHIFCSVVVLKGIVIWHYACRWYIYRERERVDRWDYRQVVFLTLQFASDWLQQLPTCTKDACWNAITASCIGIILCININPEWEFCVFQQTNEIDQRNAYYNYPSTPRIWALLIHFPLIVTHCVVASLISLFGPFLRIKEQT